MTQNSFVTQETRDAIQRYLIHQLKVYTDGLEDAILDTGEWSPSKTRIPDWIYNVSPSTLPFYTLTLKLDAARQAGRKLTLKEAGVSYEEDSEHPWRIIKHSLNEYVNRAIKDRQDQDGKIYHTSKESTEETILPYGCLNGLTMIQGKSNPFDTNAPAYLQYPADAVARKDAKRVYRKIPRGITRTNQLSRELQHTKTIMGGALARAGWTDYDQSCILAKSGFIYRTSPSIRLIDIDHPVPDLNKRLEAMQRVGLEPTGIIYNEAKGSLQLFYAIASVEMSLNDDCKGVRDTAWDVIKQWAVWFLNADPHAAGCRMQNPYSVLFNHTDAKGDQAHRAVRLNGRDAGVIMYQSEVAMRDALTTSGLWSEKDVQRTINRANGVKEASQYIHDQLLTMKATNEILTEAGIDPKKVEQASRKAGLFYTRFLEKEARDGFLPGTLLADYAIQELGYEDYKAPDTLNALAGMRIPVKYDLKEIHARIKDGSLEKEMTEREATRQAASRGTGRKGPVVPRSLRDLPRDGSLSLGFCRYINETSHGEYDLTSVVSKGSRHSCMMFVTGKMHGLGSGIEVISEVLDRIPFEVDEDLEGMKTSVLSTVERLPRYDEIRPGQDHGHDNEEESPAGSHGKTRTRKARGNTGATGRIPVPSAFTITVKKAYREERGLGRMHGKPYAESYREASRKGALNAREVMTVEELHDAAVKGAEVTRLRVKESSRMQADLILEGFLSAKPRTEGMAHYTWDYWFSKYSSPKGRARALDRARELAPMDKNRQRALVHGFYSSARSAGQAMSRAFGRTATGGLGVYAEEMARAVVLGHDVNLSIRDIPQEVVTLMLSRLRSLFDDLHWYAAYNHTTYEAEWNRIRMELIRAWDVIEADEVRQLEAELEYSTRAGVEHPAVSFFAGWMMYKRIYDPLNVIPSVSGVRAPSGLMDRVRGLVARAVTGDGLPGAGGPGDSSLVESVFGDWTVTGLSEVFVNAVYKEASKARSEAGPVVAVYDPYPWSEEKYQLKKHGTARYDKSMEYRETTLDVMDAEMAQSREDLTIIKPGTGTGLRVSAVPGVRVDEESRAGKSGHKDWRMGSSMDCLDGFHEVTEVPVFCSGEAGCFVNDFLLLDDGEARWIRARLRLDGRLDSEALTARVVARHLGRKGMVPRERESRLHWSREDRVVAWCRARASRVAREWWAGEAAYWREGVNWDFPDRHPSSMGCLTVDGLAGLPYGLPAAYWMMFL